MFFPLLRFKQWVQSLPGPKGKRGIWLPSSPADYFERWKGVQRYGKQIKPMPAQLTWSIFSGMTSFLGMATLGLIQKYGHAIATHNLPFAIAPFGATAVLAFALPAAPLAQPRNIVFGHLSAALVGIFVHKIFQHIPESLAWLPGALAVGFAIFVMGLINCYHPPAGATAFLAGFASPDVRRVGWWYPLYPVLPGALIMCFVALCTNNLSRVYPVYWITPAKPLPLIGVKGSESPEPTRAATPDLPGPHVVDVAMEKSKSRKSQISEIHLEDEDDVISHLENERSAEKAWVVRRIKELERELDELKEQERDILE